MTETIHEFYSQPAVCTYLPEEKVSFHYLLIEDGQTITYQHILERGYRRFGKMFFRHNCKDCKQCQSIRIPVDIFKPSKSQRRVWNKNQDIEVTISRPQVSQEHIDLYNLFHAYRAENRNWNFSPIDPDDYLNNFVEGHQKYGWEFQYRKNNELVGVGLVDEVFDSLSSVYFYYSPAWSKNSPGTFSVLKEIEIAKTKNKQYLHLGYWIEKNQSMKYKASFRPHELLKERTAFDQLPNWQTQEGAHEE